MDITPVFATRLPRAALSLSLGLLLLGGCASQRPVRRPAAPPPGARVWPQVTPTDLAAANNILMRALGLVGTPYRFGGNTPETGFDCSGFVRTIFEQAKGMVLPRRANEQAAATAVIDKKDLQPGDLVFFNTMRRAFSHVGIYVGDGKFIHAPRSGAEVRVEDMSVSYWQRRFNGARRVQPDEAESLSAAASKR